MGGRKLLVADAGRHPTTYLYYLGYLAKGPPHLPPSLLPLPLTSSRSVLDEDPGTVIVSRFTGRPQPSWRLRRKLSQNVVEESCHFIS